MLWWWLQFVLVALVFCLVAKFSSLVGLFWSIRGGNACQFCMRILLLTSFRSG
jgi:hypothetical protein